ncbi:hypothetical protein DFH08DRAFT_978123 [Mycena albidolilacea]|uniref:Uncharacterized protein n=1 Tax=Mycena albidolilacea TaxID=1033008 RepID=A0AAD6YZE1_9AGAR|nr:hypothetical protein DFH08DRAFT_978123 [Mycena albidolilacea]
MHSRFYLLPSSLLVPLPFAIQLTRHFAVLTARASILPCQRRFAVARLRSSHSPSNLDVGLVAQTEALQIVLGASRCTQSSYPLENFVTLSLQVFRDLISICGWRASSYYNLV